MRIAWVAALSLAAAAAFAVATALKHRSAGYTPSAHRLQPRAVVRLITDSLVHPLWIGGFIADTVGLTLQVIALHVGALAVVQPLMVTSLLFAIPLNHRLHSGRITRREITWGLVLTAGLAGFLGLADVRNPLHASAAGADRGAAEIIAALALSVSAACVFLARRRAHNAGALLGVVLGITFAANAALIKACGNIAARNPTALFSAWQLYALVLLGGTGLVLNQLAFQTGPLTASLPAIATVDPLLSVLIGVFVYDEQLRHSPQAILGQLICLLLLTAAAVRLTQTASPHRHPSDGRP